MSARLQTEGGSGPTSSRRESEDGLAVAIAESDGATATVAPKQLALFEHDRTVLAPEPRKKPWAWLLRHVFQVDVATCLRCGGATRLLEAATTPEAIAMLLAKHGLGPRPPPPRAAPSGQLRLVFSTA